MAKKISNITLGVGVLIIFQGLGMIPLSLGGVPGDELSSVFSGSNIANWLGFVRGVLLFICGIGILKRRILFLKFFKLTVILLWLIPYLTITLHYVRYTIHMMLLKNDDLFNVLPLLVGYMLASLYTSLLLCYTMRFKTIVEFQEAHD